MKKKYENVRDREEARSYDPHKLFRQEKRDGLERLLESEDAVVEREYDEKPKVEKYSHIKNFLKTMNQRGK